MNAEQSAAIVREKIAAYRQAECDLAMKLSLMKNADAMYDALTKCAAYLDRVRTEMPHQHPDFPLVRMLAGLCQNTVAKVDEVGTLAEPEPFTGLRTI